LLYGGRAPGLVHQRFLRGITARVFVVSGVITLILAAAFALLIFAVREQRDAGKLALRSQEAITAGSELQKSVISLENGLRGFVASGRDRSLESWNAALKEYPGQARRLSALVSDEPSQQALVRKIDTEIDDYVGLWGMPLLSLARADITSARSVIVGGKGRVRIEAIRADFARLFSQERAVAASREHRAEGQSSLAIGAGIGGFGLVFILALGFTLFLRRFVVKPVKAVAGASGQLASGDLAVRVPPQSDDELGDLARAFNAMADSLERSRAELDDRTHELERSNEELERFGSVVSHDLQAPLATVSMYAQLLERRHAAELGDDRRIVDGICAATAHARELIRDLLEYSKAGRGELRSEAVDANALVNEVLELLAAPIEEAGAAVTVGDLPVLRADPGNLRQVFQNLIGNAIKFSEGEPEVRVSADIEKGYWRFSVSDNGIGMDPEEARDIFEPFHRLHGDGHYPGTGIGLAVCERIVEHHGGRIWAESVPGRGSTFNFTLPADPGTGARRPAPRGEAAVA
jgi:signal transduction histidine kinase